MRQWAAWGWRSLRRGGACGSLASAAVRNRSGRGAGQQWSPPFAFRHCVQWLRFGEDRSADAIQFADSAGWGVAPYGAGRAAGAKLAAA